MAALFAAIGGAQSGADEASATSASPIAAALASMANLVRGEDGISTVFDGNKYIQGAYSVSRLRMRLPSPRRLRAVPSPRGATIFTHFLVTETGGKVAEWGPFSLGAKVAAQARPDEGSA